MKKVFLLFCIMVLTSVPALAMHDTTQPEAEILKERIAETAPEPQELSPLTVEFGTVKLSLSGLVETEASLTHPEGGDEEDELKLSTVQLGLAAELNQWLGGHIIGLWEEDDTEPAEIDEAVMVLSLPESVYGQALSLSGGRQYLPFGNYNSSMVSDPLTLDLGETRSTSVVLGSEGELGSAWLGGFDGKIEDDTKGLDTWVASIIMTPYDGVSLGVSYLSDLAESGADLVQEEALYNDEVAGFSAFLSLQHGPFGFDAEWLTTLEDFDRDIVAVGEDLTGKRPGAWFVEGTWSATDRLLFVLRHDQAHDYQANTRRTGVTASYGLCDYAQISVEYLRGDNTDDDPIHTYTAQLAMEF